MQEIDVLERIMASLRDPEGGCPWDLRQDFASIAPHTLEEAYEVVDAIENGSPASLRDELGDLLLQVLYHARMAEERGWFDLRDVAEGLRSKLVRRHPHVFGHEAAAAEMPSGAIAEETGAVDDIPRTWEAVKAAERAADRPGDARGSALDGVTRALPATTRAAKLQRRAARAGFDWPDAEGPRAKVLEELDEIREAASQEDAPAIEAEIGDLLFAAVNLARHLGVDPERALRGTNARFEARYRLLESELARRGLDPSAQTIEVLESAWQRAKAASGPE